MPAPPALRASPVRLVELLPQIRQSVLPFVVSCCVAPVNPVYVPLAAVPLSTATGMVGVGPAAAATAGTASAGIAWAISAVAASSAARRPVFGCRRGEELARRVRKARDTGFEDATDT